MENTEKISSTEVPQQSSDGKEELGTGFIVWLAFCSLIGFLICCGNGLVIVTYWTKEIVWRKTPNIFVFNLAIADFFVGFLNIPVYVTSEATLGSAFNETACKMVLAIGYLVTYIAVLLIILIVVFRLVMIIAPVWFRTRIKRKHLKLSLVALWLLCFVFYLCVSFAWPAITGSHLVDFENECLMEYLYSTQMTIFMICYEFVVPFTVLTGLSILLYVKVRYISLRVEIGDQQTDNARSNRARKGGSLETAQDDENQHGRRSNEYNGTNMIPTDQPSTSKVNEEPAGKRDKRKDTAIPLNAVADENNILSYVDTTPTTSSGKTLTNAETPKNGPVPAASAASSWRKHPSERVTQRRRPPGPVLRHRRAALRIFVLVAVFVICWVPFHTISLVLMICPACVSATLFHGISAVLILNSLVNPILYAFLDSSFRRGILRL